MRGERTAIEREMFTAVVLETVFGIGNSPLLSRVRFFIFPSSDQADSYRRDKHFRGWRTTLYPSFSSGG